MTSGHRTMPHDDIRTPHNDVRTPHDGMARTPHDDVRTPHNDIRTPHRHHLSPRCPWIHPDSSHNPLQVTTLTPKNWLVKWDDDITIPQTFIGAILEERRGGANESPVLLLASPPYHMQSPLPLIPGKWAGFLESFSWNVQYFVFGPKKSKLRVKSELRKHLLNCGTFRPQSLGTRNSSLVDKKKDLHITVPSLLF